MVITVFEKCLVLWKGPSLTWLSVNLVTSFFTCQTYTKKDLKGSEFLNFGFFFNKEKKVAFCMDKKYLSHWLPILTHTGLHLVLGPMIYSPRKAFLISGPNINMCKLCNHHWTRGDKEKTILDGGHGFKTYARGLGLKLIIFLELNTLESTQWFFILPSLKIFSFLIHC